MLSSQKPQYSELAQCSWKVDLLPLMQDLVDDDVDATVPMRLQIVPPWEDDTCAFSPCP